MHVFRYSKERLGHVFQRSISASARPTEWITSCIEISKYNDLSDSNRRQCLQDMILPSIKKALRSSSLSIAESEIDYQTKVHHQLSRHKKSIFLAMQLRDDIASYTKFIKQNASAALNALSVSNKDESLAILKVLDKCLQSWLSISFSMDNISLKQVTFNSSSGEILEKIARGESVHRVRSLSELKRRLHDGKRCFSFMHPALPEDPLVFVHVALASNLCSSLRDLDNFKNDQSPSHAMFYSINSPHSALRGLDIASLLIKEVAGHLKETLPSLRVFSTLSPIPSFLTWIDDLAKSKKSIALPTQIAEQLKLAIDLARSKSIVKFADSDSISPMSSIASILRDPSAKWSSDEDMKLTLKEPLLWLGSHYVAREKAPGRGQALPMDEVARFHLRNGAIFHQINWMGNPSMNGINTSSGMMVNYLYDFDLVKKNATQFETDPSLLPISSAIESILKTKP